MLAFNQNKIYKICNCIKKIAYLNLWLNIFNQQKNLVLNSVI